MENWLLKDLNDAQREAVETTDGPLLVIAGAGSGKTRVITYRLAHILTQRLAEPYQVLAVTFTNKAAGEMRDRVAELLGGGVNLNVSTFHSFCAKFLRYESSVIGYDSGFTIFDTADSVSLMKTCLKELGFADNQFPPKGQLRKISDAKNQLIGPSAFAAKAAGYFESRTAELYTLYQRRLTECNGMDFDDLLFNTVGILKNFPEVALKYQRRFKYLLVDEYQDTNRVQYLLLKHILGEAHNNICVVGDEDQSIYGWRGADINNILDFEKDFPGAKTIKLERNYRSTNIILKAASSVIKHNEMRKGKELYSDTDGGDKVSLMLVDSAEDEARKVIDQIERRRGDTSLKDTVILYRTNAQSRPFEEQLRRRNLPYQIVGGLSFYQRKEIKDLMAYLKLIANPKDDVSFGRVINYPKRAIGTKTVGEIMAYARQNSMSYLEGARRASEIEGMGARAKRIVPFVNLIDAYIKQMETEPVDLLTQRLVEELQLIDCLLEEDKATGRTKVENIEAFVEGTSEFAKVNSEAGLADYLAEISLYTDMDSFREIEDKVTQMTIHAAKGLEFDTVYLVGLEEGLLPLDKAISEPELLEEERRLFYVGSTRAKRRLCLSSATTRFRFGQVESIPSRFIGEIDEDLIQQEDLRTRRFSDSYAPHRSSSERKIPTSPRAAAVSHDPLPKKSPATEGVHYEYEESEILQVGRIVQHPTFGRGKIMKVEGFGESLRLEVMFSGLGIKKILAKYARLKVIG